MTHRPRVPRGRTAILALFAAASCFSFGAGSWLPAQQALEKLPPYTEHQDLSYYLDATGQKVSIKTIADWEIRRRHVRANMLDVMDSLQGKEKRVPLDVQMVEEVRVRNLTRRKITFQAA